MLFRHIVCLHVLLSIPATPCSMAAYPLYWQKDPNSKSRLFAFQKNGKVGFIDSSGKVVIPAKIDSNIGRVGDFVDGLVRIEGQGYLKEDGTWLVKRNFFWQHDFADGIGLVTEETDDKQLRDVLLNTQGQVVTKLSNGRVNGRFSEGLVAYRESNFFGFLDRAGDIAIRAAYADVGPFRGGLARATPDGYCHIATPDGRRIGTPTTGYKESCGGAPDAATIPCKVGFINPKGEFAIKPLFDSAMDFSEGLAAVKSGNLWGFINQQGAYVVSPSYEAVQPFREGLAPVKQDGKWGFIDQSGIVIIAPQFHWATSFSDSLALVGDPNGNWYIDRSGRTIIPGPFREATPFVHGLAAIFPSKTRVAYINKSGRIVFEYTRRAR